MTLPTVYKSTDGNAPVLCGTRTSLVAVLTACLVDGYGTKLPAGWTRPFVSADGTQAAFRSNPANGTGFFLRVDGLTGATANQTIVTPFEIMTSEMAGTNPFGWASDIYALISATAGTTARPWVLIATDTWIYFFCHVATTVMPSTETDVYNGGTSSLCFFFGDFEKLYPDDAFNCLFHWTRSAGGGTNSGSFGHAAASTNTGTTYAYIARALTGAVGGVMVCTPVGPPVNGGNSNAYGSELASMTYSAATGVYASKLLINNGAALTVRGFMPGVLVPLVRNPYLNLQEVTLDGKNYLYVMWRCDRYQNHGVAGLFFALSE